MPLLHSAGGKMQIDTRRREQNDTKRLKVQERRINYQPIIIVVKERIHHALDLRLLQQPCINFGSG